MKIRDLLSRESIQLNVAPVSKAEAINKLADLMDASGKLSDKEQYIKDVLKREASGTTGLGDGIATPHAKSAGVRTAGLSAMTVPQGMDFEARDEVGSELVEEPVGAFEQAGNHADGSGFCQRPCRCKERG